MSIYYPKNKTHTLGLSIFLCLFVSMSGFSQERETNKSNAPIDKNVLFIVVDDLTKTLGCYGNTVVKTPNIDKLADMGIKFNGAYCNYSVCNPSRSSLLTGLRPETTTILDNTKPLQSILGDRITLPALFKQNGYYTMDLGKIFHRPEEKHNDLEAWDEFQMFGRTPIGKTGEKRNFTGDVMKWCYWQATEGGDEDLPDGQVAKKAVEFIKAKKEQPFFLAVGFAKPHDPYVAPKKYFDMYPLEDMIPHVPPEDWNAPHAHTFPHKSKVFPKGAAILNNFTEQDKKEFLRSYYACTTYMDAQLGKILDALKESGQIDNTLIVFFGDHGYHLGEQNWWNKFTLYERANNAPFIMAGASVKEKGVTSESLFEFIDIYPTLAELLQLKNTPGYLEGKSFAKLLDDPSESFRTSVQAVMTRGDLIGRSVKNKKWRYIEWENGTQGVELYDQEKDPLEYKNLAHNAEYSEIMVEMKKLLRNEEKF